jgi:hypothetical protein
MAITSSAPAHDTLARRGAILELSWDRETLPDDALKMLPFFNETIDGDDTRLVLVRPVIIDTGRAREQETHNCRHR